MAQEIAIFQGFFVYDADAHVMVSQRMWDDMPELIRQRRPHPVRIVSNNAAEEIYENKKLIDSQKRKILPDNGAVTMRNLDRVLIHLKRSVLQLLDGFY